MSAIGKKRKVDSERRTFNPEWDKYFSLNALDRRSASFEAVFKEFIVRHQRETQHQASNCASLSAAERKETILKLSDNLQKALHF